MSGDHTMWPNGQIYTRQPTYVSPSREVEDVLRDRIAELEAALRRIIGTAGHPNAAEGCRLIINCAQDALNRK